MDIQDIIEANKDKYNPAISKMSLYLLKLDYCLLVF